MDLVRREDAAPVHQHGRCLAVVGVGRLCGAECPDGQVRCLDHLKLATLDRRQAEAELEGARTAAMTRTAQALDRMVEVLVDVASSAEVEEADRIRAASKVLDIGGMLGRNGGAVVSLTQTNVTLNAPPPGEVADTDLRLLGFMEQLGPEGAERARLLRQVIETGVHDPDAA